jgi:DNA-nicking Smr family endonuclease
MSHRKPRVLRPEEKALWSKAMEQTTRSKPEKREAMTSQPKPKPVSKPTEKAKIQSFRITGRPTQTPRVQTVPHPKPDHPLAMDHKAYRKLKSGKLAPEARLDLHGYTLAQAHPRLTSFILDSAAQKRRLVLVITGKGRGDPNDGPLPVRPGALRHTVPHWLHSPPLKSHVLQISEAHLRHGGHGALYVYLRRSQ